MPGQLQIGQIKCKKDSQEQLFALFNFNILKLALLHQNNWRHARRKGATDLLLHSASASVLYMHVPRSILKELF